MFSVAPIVLPTEAPELLQGDSQRYAAVLQAGMLGQASVNHSVAASPTVPGSSASLGSLGPLRPDQALDGRWHAGGQPPDFQPHPPTRTSPDTEPGGLIDLFNFPSTNAPLQDSAPAPETQDVLRMLESLSYLPSAMAAEAAGARTAPADSADHATRGLDEDNPPLTRGGATIEPSRETNPARMGTAALDNETSQGGLITLRTDAEIMQSWTPDSDSLNAPRSLLDVPLEMDAVYGKFHAFEVSTAEPESAHEAPTRTSPEERQPPHSIDAGGLLPHADQAVATPHGELLDESSLRAEALPPPVPTKVDGSAGDVADGAVAAAVDLIMAAHGAQPAWYPAVGALYAGYLVMVADRRKRAQREAEPRAFLRSLNEPGTRRLP